jgi:hypothetical protein
VGLVRNESALLFSRTNPIVLSLLAFETGKNHIVGQIMQVYETTFMWNSGHTMTILVVREGNRFQFPMLNLGDMREAQARWGKFDSYSHRNVESHEFLPS